MNRVKSAPSGPVRCTYRVTVIGWDEPQCTRLMEQMISFPVAHWEHETTEELDG